MTNKWLLSLAIIATVGLIETIVFLPVYLHQNPDFFASLLPPAQTVILPSPEKNAKKFAVYDGEQKIKEFMDGKEAIVFAKSLPNEKRARIAAGSHILWNRAEIKNKKENRLIDAPHINQLPELPLGCEVTALAMLLQYNGFQVNKMELAEQLAMDPTPLTYDDQGMHWGNPYKGFVGDMSDRAKPGFGVFDKPIEALARKYAGEQVINLTGLDFTDITKIVQNGTPVWVIVSSTFSRQNNQKISWMTSDGPIVTIRNEHSVLLTGVDGNYVYFNNPLKQDGKNNKKAIQPFTESWEMMGGQAITILK